LTSIYPKIDTKEIINSAKGPTFIDECHQWVKMKKSPFRRPFLCLIFCGMAERFGLDQIGSFGKQTTKPPRGALSKMDEKKVELSGRRGRLYHSIYSTRSSL
jgi:hypothetical protein